MSTIIALRCPYCKYIWCKRGERQPVSCPRCKKRYDYPSKRKKLEEEEQVVTYDVKEFLADANRISLESNSLEETMEKVGNL